MNPVARFDDLVSGIAHVFDGLDRTVTASLLNDVPGALAAVEDGVAEGLWAAGFVAYEAAPALDPALAVRPPREDGLPLVWFGLFSDRRSDRPVSARATRPAPYTVSAWTPSIDRAAYDAAFASIRGHIAAGDTYQVNHTFRLHSAFAGDAFELYRDLALSQRGAFGAYLDLGRHVVASASPELFFRRDREVLSTRPMKGTIGRGRWSAEDDAMAARLLASRKDQAENLMIVDHLVRNDLVADGLKIRPMFLPDRFQDQAKPYDMYEDAGLNARHITATALSALGETTLEQPARA